jgi:hypothetical protein
MPRSSLWLSTTSATSKQAMILNFYRIFITSLPPLQGFDAILTIMDQLTKMTHFLPCVKSINSQETADNHYALNISLLWSSRQHN